MTRIFTYIVIGILLVSCSNRGNLKTDETDLLSFKSVRVSADDFLWDENSTRSLVEIGDKGVIFNWAQNDTIGVFPSNGFQVAFPMASGAGSKMAQFDGGSVSLRKSSLYVAYYPFDFYNRSGRNIAVSYIGQVQKGNGNTDHIGEFDYMAASAVTPENESVTFNFAHMGALLQFKLRLPDVDTLNSLTIETDEPLFTRRGYIDLMSGKSVVSSNELFKSVSMELDGIESEKEIVVYMMVAPVNLSGRELYVSLVNSKNQKICYELEGKDLEAGKAYSFYGSSGTYEDYTLQIADYRSKAVSDKGGLISLKYLSNQECYYSISDNAKEWIKPVDTKAIKEGEYKFEVLANNSVSNRIGFIRIMSVESNLAVEYGVIQGGEGSLVITEDGGSLPVGVITGSNPAVNQAYGLDKLADGSLYTQYEVAETATDLIWEGVYPIYISKIKLGQTNNEKGCKKWSIYWSGNGRDWEKLLSTRSSASYPSSPRWIESSFTITRSRYYKVAIEANYGGSATQIAELSFDEQDEMNADILTLQDLLKFGTSFSNSNLTPMGKRYENRHITTAADRTWLLDPENEPALLNSSPDYTYRKYEVNLYPFGMPSPADVNQRGVGDCSALAVFAQMAYMFPEFVKSIITDHSDGTYTVKMFDPQGYPVDVRLKSTFLGDNNGIGATAGKDGKANWATIMEKAIMKWNYIYKVNQDIYGIGTEHVVPLFTGNGNSFAITPNLLDANRLAKAVDVALKDGMFVIGGFNTGMLDVDGPITITNHAYSFMYSSDSEAMFAMRNPWGYNTNVYGGIHRADGLLHIKDDGIVPPTIDLRIVYPGVAESYLVKQLYPYTPPQYETQGYFSHKLGTVVSINQEN